MLNPPDKRLHACVRKDTGEVFYASMINIKGATAEMRSSQPVEIGLSIIMVPVPDNWNGQQHSPEEIMQSGQAMGANVIRKEGKGSFHARLLSMDQQDVANRIRAGQMSADKLHIESKEAGMIYFVELEGRIAMESAAHLKSYLSGISKDHQLILLDVSSLVYIDKNCIGMMLVAVKDVLEQGQHMAILTKADSPIEQMLYESKISTLVEIHSNRDEAVANLIRHTLT